jgi:hypothetical protein
MGGAHPATLTYKRTNSQMENEELEVLETHEIQEGETPEVEALTPAEIAELRRKADVSSQNYERAKKAEADKKRLEQELAEAQLGSDSFVTDEDTARTLRDLTEKMNRLEERAQLETVYAQYPQVKDKASEFNEFRAEYQGVSMDKVAKLFISEHDLSEGTKRKGLERAGGGTRKVPVQGLATDDLTRLRTTNFKEYVKLIKSGKLQS